MLPCKACGVLLPADPDAIGRHAETHLTELGLCRVCGASFPDRGAGAAHSLSHVGVQLFTCDMCHLQFCSQNKLLRHHRQTASSYTIPQVALTNGGQNLDPKLQCAVCAESLGADFSVSGRFRCVVFGVRFLQLQKKKKRINRQHIVQATSDPQC